MARQENDPPAGSVPDEADELYGLPLEEFTAARNRLAKELAGAGDRDVAGRVRRLRKPTRAAWALNRAARTDPGLMSRFLTTASELAEAQERLLGSGDREAFAAALAGHRAALEELLAAVWTELGEGGAAAGAMLERARTTLEATGGDARLRDELAAGRLTREHEAVGFGALASVEVPVAAAERRPPAPDRKRARDAERRASGLRRQVDAAQRRLAAARKRVEAAERQVAEAEEEVRRLEGEAAEASAVVEELS